MGIIYVLTDQNKIDLKKAISKIVRAHDAKYYKNPDQYRGKKEDLDKQWLKMAVGKACYDLFTNDGLTHIEIDKDEFYTFSDYAGECYCPIANDNRDPIELKRQEKRARARFNRLGATCVTLYVLGDRVDNMGGFVGSDFFGSGYDLDFYQTAFDILRDNEKTKDYLMEVFNYLTNLHKE